MWDGGGKRKTRAENKMIKMRVFLLAIWTAVEVFRIWMTTIYCQPLTIRFCINIDFWSSFFCWLVLFSFFGVAEHSILLKRNTRFAYFPKYSCSFRNATNFISFFKCETRKKREKENKKRRKIVLLLSTSYRNYIEVSMDVRPT